MFCLEDLMLLLQICVKVTVENNFTSPCNVCWPLVVTSRSSFQLLINNGVDNWQCLKNLLFSQRDDTKFINLSPLILYRKSATSADWSQYIIQAEGRRWPSTSQGKITTVTNIYASISGHRQFYNVSRTLWLPRWPTECGQKNVSKKMVAG